MERSEAALLALLFSLGKKALRTQIVKLTYLMDESNFRMRGATLTGFTYHLDNYGPNASGNAIVKKLDYLESLGLVTVQRRTNARGDGYFLYAIAQRDFDPSILPISDDSWIEIQTIARMYGGMAWRDVVEASKATAPMRRATPGEPLRFERDSSILISDNEVAADPFWRETLEAIADTSERIDIEDLRAEFA